MDKDTKKLKKNQKKSENSENKKQDNFQKIHTAGVDTDTLPKQSKFYDALAKQCQAEYNISWQTQKAKKDEWGRRLKLYNNQMRASNRVGDTTLFTIHQTVLASLYVDRLSVDFTGREEGDNEVAENLMMLSEYDYDDMEKDVLDYGWDFDTGFFGRGLVSLEEYLRDPDAGIYLPIPHLIDPIVFLRDPMCKSINGDRVGIGAARFFGYETNIVKRDLKLNVNIFDEFKEAKNTEIKNGSGTMSVLQDAIEARNTAQNVNTVEKQTFKEADLGPNAFFTVTVWYTFYEDEDGNVHRVKVWLANDREFVIGIKELDLYRWPIIDRALYPHSHDFDGTSISDLVEDKQRARAIAQNLSLDMMKADAKPMYIYDSNRITNKNDLKFGFNKFIPVDAKGAPITDALVPMLKSRPNQGLLDFVYRSLDVSAQAATATPEIQQGAMSGAKRTLGELNIVASKVDTRYSLSAKIFGWSERRFWRHWYNMYKDHFVDEIDEKVIEVVGAFGPKSKKFTRKDLITQRLDPNIKIESQVVSRTRQLEERQSLTQYIGMANVDPTSNKRYGLKKLGKLYSLKKDEIDRLLPQTVDERVAQQENELLNQDKFVGVLATDDHNVHLEEHSKANLTNATKAHIKTHERALSLKKENPALFPQDQSAAEFQQGSSPNDASGAPKLPLMSRGGALAPSETSNMPVM